MAVKKCLKSIGDGHPLCLSILRVRESKVLICREKIIKREKEVGRERQQMHGEIMIQNHRAKVAITWAIVEKIKSGFIDMWLVDKNKGE